RAMLSLTVVVTIRLSIAVFILPLIFIFDTRLLMLEGSILEILLSVLTALIGAFLLAIAVNRYYFTGMGYITSFILLLSALFMILPGLFTDVLGAIPAIVILYFNYLISNEMK